MNRHDVLKALQASPSPMSTAEVATACRDTRQAAYGILATLHTAGVVQRKGGSKKRTKDGIVVWRIKPGADLRPYLGADA